MQGQSSVREGLGKTEVFSRTASSQQCLEQLGLGPRDQRRETLGGKRALCVLGSCTPLLPQHNDLQGRNDSLQL